MFYLPERIHRNARLLVKNIILHYLSVNRRKFLKAIQMLYCIRYVQVETHSGIFPNISWKVYIKYRLFLCNSDKGICSFHQFPTYGFYVFNKYMTSCGQTKRRPPGTGSGVLAGCMPYHSGGAFIGRRALRRWAGMLSRYSLGDMPVSRRNTLEK